MKKFKREEGHGVSRKFGEGRNFKKGSSDKSHIMHKAICSACGRNCEVPFRPTGDKAVFCSDCFSKKNPSNNRFDRKSQNSHTENRDMYKAICSKCGRNCEVPFRPIGDKPVFCNNCFGKGSRDIRVENENIITPVEYVEYKEDFEKLNRKLDSILELLIDGPLSEILTKSVESADDRFIKEDKEAKKTVDKVDAKKSVRKAPSAKKEKKSVAPKKKSSKKTPERKKK